MTNDAGTPSVEAKRMNEGYGGFDRFRLIAALFVVAIQAHLFSPINEAFLSFAFAVKWREKIKPAEFRKGRAWVELDMSNLGHNVNALRNILPKGCDLMPAVKANAYGHGAVEICRELNGKGVRAFCVASASEGVELRKKRIKGMILILGYTHPGQFHLLRRFRLTQTVIDYEYAKALNGFGKKLTVHVKVDTGMNRLGEPSRNVENILEIFRFKNLKITGIYTHFSARSDDFTQAQADDFANALSKLKERGVNLPAAHAQSSYGVLSRPDLAFDYARVGLALYGAYSGEENDFGFKPVLSFKARISAVKIISAGEAVGYGSVFVAPIEMKIAVLSAGYADGIPRALSNGAGSVLINGTAAPIVGFVCMDQVIVDVTEIPDARQGGVATIIGKDGENEISVFDVARQAGTVPNEILSKLGGRAERVVS